jgi:hypothetical protein
VPRPRYLTAATALATCLALVLSWAVPAFAAMSPAPAATSARARSPPRGEREIEPGGFILSQFCGPARLDGDGLWASTWAHSG